MKTQKVNTDNWPTQAEAAERLGISQKSLGRYADKGMVEMRKRPTPGRKPVNVCNPDDIARLEPKAHLMPTTAITAAENTALALERRKYPDGVSYFAPLVPMMGALMQTIQTFYLDTDNREKRNEKVVFTLKEAAAFGFSMAFLRRKVEDGSLKSFRDGRTIKIAREDLRELAHQ
jgi:excisionase family DNA binding protein